MSASGSRAAALWDRLDVALSYFREHRKGQTGFSLSYLDLVMISNFKGGNASITEPLASLPGKLQPYSQELAKIAQEFGSKTLVILSDAEIETLKQLASAFLKLTRREATTIRGFKESAASALLQAFFPELLPIYDRRVLNGTNIVAVIGSRQVVYRDEYYFRLIDCFRQELNASPADSMRTLDKRFFIVPIKGESEEVDE